MSLHLRTTVAALVLAPAALAAQTVVVTPTNPQGWTASGVNATSATQITTAYPRLGAGSLELGGTDGAQAIRTRYGLFVSDLATGSFGSLGSLQKFGFDWLRDASSTVGADQAPAFRLHVRGSFGGQTGYGELIWERAYNNGGVFAAPTDAWQTVMTDLTTGSYWMHVSGFGQIGATCALGAAYQTLQTWNSGCAGQANLQIVGISAGVGSIPAADGASFRGAVDNVVFQAGGDDFARVYDFEPNAAVVPEPSTYVLMGSGLLGLAGVAARRRRQG